MKPGRYKLFDDTSKVPHSVPFTISPGMFGILHAYGFLRYVDEDITDQPRRHQQAIVQQVLVDQGVYPEEGFPCVTQDLSILYPEGMIYEDVTDCGVWCLSACANRRIIDMPGTYRLELNSETFVGDVTIVLDIYAKTDTVYPPNAEYLGD